MTRDVPAAGASSPLGRRFWQLWTAFLSSNLADGVTFIVLPWLATTVTDSPFWVGAVAAASRLPWLVAVLAGLAVDRRSPARLRPAGQHAGVPAGRRGNRGPLALGHPGIRVIVHNPLLARLAVSTVCFNLVYAAILATQVLFAQQVLGLGAAQFGFLMTCTAVGGVVGGTLSGRLSALLPSRWMPMASLAVVGGSHAAIAAAPVVAVVAPALAIGSAAVLNYSVSVVSLRQTVTARQLLGRVNAAMGTVTWGVAAIGMLAGGAAVDLLARWVDGTDALRAVYALSTLVVIVLLGTMGGASRCWPRAAERDCRCCPRPDRWPGRRAERPRYFRDRTMLHPSGGMTHDEVGGTDVG